MFYYFSRHNSKVSDDKWIKYKQDAKGLNELLSQVVLSPVNKTENEGE